MAAMKRVRAAAWILVSAGLIMGACTRQAAVDPLSYEGGVVLTADLHVHSFPGDGSMPPWDLAREAERRGLDVIALTSHNNQWSWSALQAIGGPPSRTLVIPGDEITANGYHLAAIGLTHLIDWRQSAPAAARAVREAGGVAIAAHPARTHAAGFDQAIDALDGYEAAHPLLLGPEEDRRDVRAFEARARARQPAIAAIGSSDFHFFAPLGVCRTFLFVRARTVDAVLEAIRDGHTVACDATGQTYGPPELARLVADRCREAVTAPARDATTIGTAGTVFLWLGLLGVILTGAERPR
jgi:predicted metal-dependent phosphoesterase TrpH